MATPNVLVRLHYYESNSEGRELYSSAKKDDYVNYVDKGIRQTDGKPSDYLAYTDDREKSSGVFNANGPIPVKEKKKLREKLRSTGSCIWDCVISFEEKKRGQELRQPGGGQKTALQSPATVLQVHRPQPGEDDLVRRAASQHRQPPHPPFVLPGGAETSTTARRRG